LKTVTRTSKITRQKIQIMSLSKILKMLLNKSYKMIIGMSQLKIAMINVMVLIKAILMAMTADLLRVERGEIILLEMDLGTDPEMDLEMAEIATLETDAHLGAKVEETQMKEKTLTTEMLTQKLTLKFISLVLSVKPEKMISELLLKNLVKSRKSLLEIIMLL